MRGLRKMAQYHFIPISWGFPSGSAGKESTCNAGDPGSIHGLGRSPGEGNDNLLLYSCLGNSMDKEAWQAPQSIGFSRQEYWSGLPFSSPGDLPIQGLDLGFLH